MWHWATSWLKFDNSKYISVTSICGYFIPLDMKRCICHFTKWQILFIASYIFKWLKIKMKRSMLLTTQNDGIVYLYSFFSFFSCNPWTRSARSSLHRSCRWLWPPFPARCPTSCLPDEYTANQTESSTTKLWTQSRLLCLGFSFRGWGGM